METDACAQLSKNHLQKKANKTRRIQTFIVTLKIKTINRALSLIWVNKQQHLLKRNRIYTQSVMSVCVY